MTSLDYIQNLCIQKTRMQMYRKAPVRFELVSPYTNTNYSKQEYDMRRKAEILKYSNASSKTNSLTKKQKFALTMNSNPRQMKKAQLFSNNQCSTDGLILVPTSSSNVPGPVINLYEDNNVPLIYYKTERVYSILEDKSGLTWEVLPKTDVECPDDINKQIFTLILYSNIIYKTYSFNISFPIVLSCFGYVNINNNDALVGQLMKLRLRIYNIKLNTNYNSNVIQTITTTEPGLYFDFYVNGKTNPGSFKITKYIGNVIFNNLNLYTEPNFIYDFSITFDSIMSSTNNGGFSEKTLFSLTNSGLPEDGGTYKTIFVNPKSIPSQPTADSNSMNYVNNCVFLSTTGSSQVNNGFQFISTTI
jgi:hypothetical protein